MMQEMEAVMKLLPKPELAFTYYQAQEEIDRLFAANTELAHSISFDGENQYFALVFRKADYEEGEDLDEYFSVIFDDPIPKVYFKNRKRFTIEDLCNYMEAAASVEDALAILFLRSLREIPDVTFAVRNERADLILVSITIRLGKWFSTRTFAVRKVQGKQIIINTDIEDVSASVVSETIDPVFSESAFEGAP